MSCFAVRLVMRSLDGGNVIGSHRSTFIISSYFFLTSLSLHCRFDCFETFAEQKVLLISFAFFSFTQFCSSFPIIRYGRLHL